MGERPRSELAEINEIDREVQTLQEEIANIRRTTTPDELDEEEDQWGHFERLGGLTLDEKIAAFVEEIAEQEE